jgi:hypothetical protein
MNKCETCKYWVRWEGSDCCQSAGLQKIAGPWGVLRPPADFGCRYHEEKPEHVCRNCANWKQQQVFGLMGWYPCKLQNTVRAVFLTTPDHTCDRWKGEG